MADHTSIEWTDATWNPVTGCSLVSEGCRHCYAARQTGTSFALLRNAYSQQAARGAILGAVTVKGCVTWHASEWFLGPHALVLERPRKANDPIPCKGALGLWQVPADVMAALEIPGYAEKLR